MLLSFLVLTGCGYFSENRSSLVFSRGRVFSKAELSYFNVKQNVFLKHCEACHNEANPRHGVRLDTYEQIQLNLDGVVRTTLIQKSMPKGMPLPVREIELLRAWIEAGAPRGTVAPAENKAPDDVPPIADFAYIRGPLFQKHLCYQCHRKGQRAGDIVIDQLEALLDPQYRAVIPGQPDESVLVQILETEGRKRMPPISSGPGMAPNEVKLVRDWIARGAPPFK